MLNRSDLFPVLLHAVCRPTDGVTDRASTNAGTKSIRLIQVFSSFSHRQALLARGAILTVADRARLLIIELRYGSPWYFAR